MKALGATTVSKANFYYIVYDMIWEMQWLTIHLKKVFMGKEKKPINVFKLFPFSIKLVSKLC